jgi:hypothetical protein
MGDIERLGNGKRIQVSAQQNPRPGRRAIEDGGQSPATNPGQQTIRSLLPQVLLKILGGLPLVVREVSTRV